MIVNASTLTLSQETVGNFWKASRQFADCDSIIKNILKPIEDCRTHSVLTPLLKRIRPAAVNGEKLMRIALTANDTLLRNFKKARMAESEIENPICVGQFITFHKYSSDDIVSGHRHTVGEILSQLPENIKSMPGELYYTADEVNPEELYMDGPGDFYDAAITRVFRSNPTE